MWDFQECAFEVGACGGPLECQPGIQHVPEVSCKRISRQNCSIKTTDIETTCNVFNSLQTAACVHLAASRFFSVRQSETGESLENEFDR